MTDKDFYTNAYSGSATNSWTGNPDRIKAVADALEYVEYWYQASILDLGCGAGLHTKWHAEKYQRCRWTGIDIVDAETMKLVVPENGRFAVADLRSSEGWQHPFLRDEYNLVVDQGAIFASLTDDAERDEYLARVASRLKPDGVFLALVVEGERGVMRFPDGRLRMRLSRRDIKTMKTGWLQKFGLKVINMKSKNYEANTPHNPLNEPIRAMHVYFKKLR